MLTWPAKDPDEVLDSDLDWADPEAPRLETGEVLTSSQFSVVEGDVVIDSQEYAPSGVATVWLSGGTAGMVCIILDRVTTSLGRTYDQSVKLRIKNK